MEKEEKKRGLKILKIFMPRGQFMIVKAHNSKKKITYIPEKKYHISYVFRKFTYYLFLN